MDTDAILRRHPRVAVVDEFPHTNVPGSGREKRWEDVRVLLDAGIDVLTTMNVQHLESLNDQIWQSTGVRVRETIPDWVLQEADEVVMVDLTPSALLNRLKRGVVYAPEKARAGHGELLQGADARRTARAGDASDGVCRRKPARLMTRSSQPGRPRARRASRRRARPAAHRGRIQRAPRSSAAAAVSPTTCRLTASRCAVAKQPTCAIWSHEARETLQKQLNFARGLQIDTRILEGQDVAETLVDFARMNGVTQIFVTRHKDGGLASFVRRGLVQRIVNLAADMQVTIVADRSSQRPIG